MGDDAVVVGEMRVSEFTDLRGKTWTVELTFGSIERVRKDTSVDLLDAKKLDETLTRFLTDPRHVVDFIYVLLEPEIEKEDLSTEEFGSRIGGPQVLAITNAIMEAWVDFFQQSGSVDLAQTVQTTLDQLRKARGAVADRVRTLDLTDAFDANLDKEMERIRKEYESGSGSSQAS